MAYFIVKERFTKIKVIGMMVGFIGVIPLLMTPDNVGSVAKEFFKISTGELVMIVAVLSLSYGWFIVKKLMDKGYPVLMVNGISMLAGGIGALLTSFAVDGVYPLPVSNMKLYILCTTGVIITANLFFYTVRAWLINHHSVTFLALASFCSPLFATFYGYLFLSEQLSWGYLIALVLIALGLVLFYRDELIQKRTLP